MRLLLAKSGIRSWEEPNSCLNYFLSQNKRAEVSRVAELGRKVGQHANGDQSLI